MVESSVGRSTRLQRRPLTTCSGNVERPRWLERNTWSFAVSTGAGDVGLSFSSLRVMHKWASALESHSGAWKLQLDALPRTTLSMSWLGGREFRCLAKNTFLDKTYTYASRLSHRFRERTLPVQVEVSVRLDRPSCKMPVLSGQQWSSLLDTLIAKMLRFLLATYCSSADLYPILTPLVLHYAYSY